MEEQKFCKYGNIIIILYLIFEWLEILARLILAYISESEKY